MKEDAITKFYPALAMDDENLKKELWSMICERASGSPYLNNGDAARSLEKLPRGLRAMAATHWLDLSLTLDSITWHFGNFGEPSLVAQAEAGLHELGLHDLANCFCEAKNLMLPLLADRTEEDGNPYELLERRGLKQVADVLNEKAWALHPITKSTKETESSIIYAAWVRYARLHPEHVFDVRV